MKGSDTMLTYDPSRDSILSLAQAQGSTAQTKAGAWRYLLSKMSVNKAFAAPGAMPSWHGGPTAMPCARSTPRSRGISASMASTCRPRGGWRPKRPLLLPATRVAGRLEGRTMEEVDWRRTTFNGARREQLRRWAQLPLEDILRVLEEMQELIRLLENDAR